MQALQNAYALGSEESDNTIWTSPRIMTEQDARLAFDELKARVIQEPCADRIERRDSFATWMRERFKSDEGETCPPK